MPSFAFRFLALPALAAVLTAQTDPAPLRVHIIGASVSGGFRDGPLFGAKEHGDSVTLQRVLKGWADEDARVTTHNTLEMAALFEDPIGIGGRQVAGVKKAKADVVVAIDFAFWFAYGAIPGRDEAKVRAARLARGLSMLAGLEMPVLLGDLPDMRGAATRMLAPSWIPPKAVLAALNAQLAAFAAKHDHIRVVTMADTVRRMREKGITLPLAAGAIATPKGALQQADRLHATRLGVAYLAFTLQPDLQRALPAAHALRGREWAFERFVEAAGAEDELDELIELGAGAGK